MVERRIEGFVLRNNASTTVLTAAAGLATIPERLASAEAALGDLAAAHGAQLSPVPAQLAYWLSVHWDLAAAAAEPAVSAEDYPMIAQVRTALAAGELSPEPVSTPQHPYVELDVHAGKIVLVLPPVPDSADSPEPARWWVDAGFDSFRISQRLDEEGRALTQRVTIVQPTEKISVTASTTGEKYRLELSDGAVPAVLFGSDGRRLVHQYLVNEDSVFVLAPSSATIVLSYPDEDGNLVEQEAEPSDDMRFTSWPDWSLRQLTGLGSVGNGDSIVELRLGRGEQLLRSARVVSQQRQAAVRFYDQDHRIADITGLDGQPVFSASPLLAIPPSTGSWSAEIYYCDGQAARELVEELVDLVPGGQPVELFADIYEDAWVGHYEVDVRCDGHLMARQSFNLAEGFDLRVSYSDGASFRHPDQAADSHAYTKAYYAQRTAAAKPIEVPFTRTQAIERSADSDRIRISNPVGYGLDLIIRPKALRYMVDVRGELPAWQTQPSTVATASLSSTGEFKVSFPEAIPGSAALLLTHELSRKVKVISLKRHRHGEVFTTSNKAITNAFPQAHAGVVATLVWHTQLLEEAWASAPGDFPTPDAFSKAYQSFATTDVELATIIRLSDMSVDLEAALMADRLSFRGSTQAKELDAFLWPMTRPDIEPWRVRLSSTLAAELPAELSAAGPLAVEVLDSPLSFPAKAPARPSARAQVVDQPGHMDSLDGGALAWKLSTANERTTFDKTEQAAAWRHLYAVHHLPAPALRQAALVARKTINSDPRHMLEALGRSNVRVGDQPALAIGYGLMNFDFHANGPRQVHFRASAWVRVLEQLNDVVDGRLDEPGAYADAVDFLSRMAGVQTLEFLARKVDSQLETTDTTQAIMRQVVAAAADNSLAGLIESLNDVGATRGIADDAALRHGWFELLRRRKKFEDIAGFAQLRTELLAQEANIGGRDIRRHLLLLRKFASTHGQRQRNQWAWAPYLSAVAAHVSRAAAAEQRGLERYFLPLSGQQLATWADVAQLIPTLCAYDLIREEARQLGRAHGPITLGAAPKAHEG